MFCSVNPIMNFTLFTFSIWKDSVTFSELEHWMEEHLDFLYEYCRAFNSSADEIESSEMFATDYVRAFFWNVEVVTFPAWKWCQKVKHQFYHNCIQALSYICEVIQK